MLTQFFERNCFYNNITTQEFLGGILGYSTDINAQAEAYYKKQYSGSNPSEKNKVSYTVKKGDSLWSIAKENVNKKDAKNSEIHDLMYAIAKLNNKDTIEAANNLEVNDVIYLPKYIQNAVKNPQVANDKPTHKTKPVSVRNVKATSAEIKDIITPKNKSLSYNQEFWYRKNSVDNIPKDLYVENGKAGINYWNDILNDKDNKLIIDKSYTYLDKPTGLVITKKENDERYGKTEANLLVQVDDKGKFKRVSFDSPGVNIHSTNFDYEIDAKGNLKRPIGAYGEMETIDKMKPDEYKELVNTLQRYVDEKIK